MPRGLLERLRMPNKLLHLLHTHTLPALSEKPRPRRHEPPGFHVGLRSQPWRNILSSISFETMYPCGIVHPQFGLEPWQIFFGLCKPIEVSDLVRNPCHQPDSRN